MKPKKAKNEQVKSAARKTKAPASKPSYADLKNERDQLLLEIEKVQKQRDAYSKAVSILMAKQIPVKKINKKKILAQVGKLKPLSEFLADLEAEFVTPGQRP